MSIPRKTIKAPRTIEGIGLFTAAPAALTIHPNHQSTGIVFTAQATTIAGNISNLSDAPPHPVFAQMKPRCTSIRSKNINIATIEHLMSALAGLAISDARIELTGPEIPILDGSALPFIELITDAGIETLDTTIEPIRINQPVTVSHNDAAIAIEPADAASYTYHLDFGDHSPIQKNSVSWNGDADEYTSRIAPARTFCLDHEADAMRTAGLFTHLTERDMLVIGPCGPINNTLRDPDEPALHKLLDLIGDLSLVGRPLVAKVTATKSGHTLAHQAARAIVEQI